MLELRKRVNNLIEYIALLEKFVHQQDVCKAREKTKWQCLVPLHYNELSNDSLRKR